MTERAKFYFLQALFNIYDKWDSEELAITATFPDGYASITSVVFHIASADHTVTRRDVDLLLPIAIRENLVKEKQGKFEKEYMISIEGMKEYMRLWPQFGDHQIERAEYLIQDCERRAKHVTIQISKTDYQNVLYHLYEKYREARTNRYQFVDMPDNYNTIASISAKLQALDKTFSAPIQDILEYLDSQRLVKFVDHGKGDLRYRISGAGIQHIENELDKKHSPLSLSVQNGQWLPPKVTPILASLIESSASTTMKPVLNTPTMDATKPTGKIFISHSVKDEDISEAFQQQILQLALHIPAADIFNISVPESSIKGGQDFKHRIHTELKYAKAVIMLITENYKNSQVCLNEMGAAWMLSDNIPVIPFILAPITHKTVGFIHDTTQQLQIDSADDLIKFVSENKGTDKLFDAHYNDATLKKAISAVHKVINEREKPVPNSELGSAKVKKTGSIGSTKQPIEWVNSRDDAESNRSVRAELLKKYFIVQPEHGKFYQLNNHGQYYYFDVDQFRLIPNVETRCFFGWEKFKGHTNLTVPDEDDLSKLIGEPMQDIYDMPRYRVSADKTCWLEYKGRRHQVMSNELNDSMHQTAEIVPKQELLKIPVGNQFIMPS